ncbi:DUF1801 domain-containing protein [Gilvimarinus sp. SDUM040013]|uniref:DUF1801 domain-containing protein n=1 Tax=Gilvimarinus gilvus TaxID=3058038 RepID=A0ABU4RZC7_9GAMM|nr:DUF1801 domain-containing protein [Gilvimarinus sp. SDUM040013]MDO3384636.1 DUF1801 domain-containing protein [Gilvimarinus sp. SDUM040013]MDX6850222.1 DUF1801 domain-containing protein [Gilvimarinus sp. SDUM040013]
MNAELLKKFSLYPPLAQQQLHAVRELIGHIAQEYSLGAVEESIKWGEASYTVKGGSAVRMDWKPATPNAIKLFFHCQTKLVETFKEIYPHEFVYEGNRALVIPLTTDIATSPLAHCLQMTLSYHRVKHLPLLGA